MNNRAQSKCFGRASLWIVSFGDKQSHNCEQTMGLAPKKARKQRSSPSDRACGRRFGYAARFIKPIPIPSKTWAAYTIVASTKQVISRIPVKANQWKHTTTLFGCMCMMVKSWGNHTTKISLPWTLFHYNTYCTFAIFYWRNHENLIMYYVYIGISRNNAAQIQEEERAYLKFSERYVEWSKMSFQR